MSVDVSNTTRMACNPGTFTRLETVRLGQGPGAGQDGTVREYVEILGVGNDWPGRQYGIREPLPTETPLSWPEVLIALRGLREEL